MDDFFKGAIGCAVLVVVAGIVGASLSGSERAFDLAPFLALAQREGTAPASQAATNPPNAVGGQVQPPPAPSREALLALCPPGSIDETAAPVPLARAQSLQQAVLNGQHFADLIDIQAALGQPTCNFSRNGTRQYRYLVESNKAIDALQSGDMPDVLVLFENF